MQHVAQHRKHLEDARRNRRALRLRREAESQVLFDGEPRKDLASLRDVPEAEARALVRRESRHVGAVEADRAGARRQQSREALEQRRLAHAVAAEDRRDSAGRRLERDVAQRVAAAVILVEAGNRQHDQRPR